jgi:hypothetical protein
MIAFPSYTFLAYLDWIMDIVSMICCLDWTVIQSYVHSCDSSIDGMYKLAPHANG